MIYNEAYRKEVLRDWQRFVENGTELQEERRAVRQVILDSWRISREKGVDPLRVKGEKVSDEMLEMIVKKKEELIAVAHSYMENLYSFIQGSNFMVILTNEQGCVIDIIANDEGIREKAKDSRLSLGTNRSEAYAGTNGIGTCLRLNAPIQIIGEEHYIKPHHVFVCSAAPIHDERGEIIGCLDIVGPRDLIHTHTLGMVCAAVDGIEKGLKMQRTNRKMSVINHQMDKILQIIATGIILADGDGVMTQYNHHAFDILKIPKDRFSGINIRDIFQEEASSISLHKIEQSFTQKEVNLKTVYGESVNILLSAHIIYDNHKNKESVLLTFEELGGIHKLVSKMSGYTAKYSFDSIIGNSRGISNVKELGNIAAQSISNVLIMGESGTGKELVAQSIHNASTRAAGPFIAINCGSIPKSLIESELFGYERGAFTGANKEGAPGKFELAEGGTIFLDEIGDMPIDLQTSLLRVIQSREIIRVGGKHAKTVDVRIIAATNVNLMEKIQAKHFRNDLYYRLNVLSIVIPPLRDRLEDIIPLAEYFAGIYGRAMNKEVRGIAPRALEILLTYRWPGNIRELENIVERAINLVKTNCITESELPEHVLAAERETPAKMEKAGELGRAPRPLSPVKMAEYTLIINELERQKGNVKKAANALGMPRRTMYRKLEKYQIDLDRYR